MRLIQSHSAHKILYSFSKLKGLMICLGLPNRMTYILDVISKVVIGRDPFNEDNYITLCNRWIEWTNIGHASKPDNCFRRSSGCEVVIREYDSHTRYLVKYVMLIDFKLVYMY